MKKFLLNDTLIGLKKKTISEKIIDKDSAMENFEIFVKEYTDVEDIAKIDMEKSEFIDFVLANYSVSNTQTFIKYSNAFIKKANTLEGYFIKILMALGYKVTDLIPLTYQELFNVFTFEFYNKICASDPNKAMTIVDDLMMFGIGEDEARVYASNGIPKGVEEETTPKQTTELEDMKTLEQYLKNE